MNNIDNQMFQVATLQSLMLGYSKNVISVEELASRGDVGLGTFEDVNGELIMLDQKVYKADNEGRVELADLKKGVPFAAVAFLNDPAEFRLGRVSSMEELKKLLNNAIEEDFGLNSMYAVRIDGHFSTVKARSEEGQCSHHVELSQILKKNQKDFMFEDVSGTMVCLYFPDYMDGINAAGWHLHFVSDDRSKGGHVYDLAFEEASAKRKKLHNIHIQLPSDVAFDTYSLKSVSNDEVKKVEQ